MTQIKVMIHDIFWLPKLPIWLGILLAVPCWNLAVSAQNIENGAASSQSNPASAKAIPVSTNTITPSSRQGYIVNVFTPPQPLNVISSEINPVATPHRKRGDRPELRDTVIGLTPAPLPSFVYGSYNYSF
ncbi:MAG: hypothetical protein WBB82_13055 [Limnothrix sp.]